MAYENFLDDQHSWDRYSCSYEKHIIDIIDRLSNECRELVPTEAEPDVLCLLEYNDHTNTKQTNQCSQNQSSVTCCIEAHVGLQARKQGVSKDVLVQSKRVGFLNHHAAKFSFVGPYRDPVKIDSIDECL